MAEVQQKEGGGKPKGGKPKQKKSSTHMDMTPMVDLAALLLTFFMLTTSFNQPKTMEIVMPDEPKDEQEDQPQINMCNVLNLLLDNNNKIYYYSCKVPYEVLPEDIQVTDYSDEGLRTVLLKARRDNKQRNGGEDKLMVLIKPGMGSKYGNIVDVFDEMNITEMQRYALVDMALEEQQQLDNLE